MDAIEMRAATPDDAEAVERYHDRCLRSTCSAQLLAGDLEAPDREGTRQQLHAWWLAAGGHAELESHARVENVAAIAFYEAAVWTATDRLIHTFEHGISYDEHVLVKRRL